MWSPKVVATSRGRLESTLGVPLREYSFSEVEEMAWRLRDVQWDQEGGSSKVVASLPEDLQQYIFNEIQLSKVDFAYWAERYARIVDDRGLLRPIRFWPSQRAIIQRLGRWEEEQLHHNARDFVKVFLLILKARQLGQTVLAQALLAHLTYFYGNTRSIIASDHPDNSLKLWQVALRMYENLPGWMRPLADGRVKATNLHLSELDSDIIVGAGNQKTTLGQGMTVDAAHLTELSSWLPENTDALDADFLPAFMSSRKHHSLCVMESTAEGGKGNYFHDRYQAARREEGFFRAVFLGWFMAPDKWQLPSEGVELGEEVQKVAQVIRRTSGVELTREQMAFWQVTKADYTSRGKVDAFYQEFPSTPEEAFQTGVRSVFPLEVRTALRAEAPVPVGVLSYLPERRAFEVLLGGEEEGEARENVLRIWEKPQPGFLYVIGVDVSYGQDGGDSSAIQVIRVGNRSTPDEQVAEWCGTINPVELAQPIWLLGHMYADRADGLPAKLAIETNPGSPGLVTQTELIRRGYPHFYTWRKPNKLGKGFTKEVGWWTTPGTRPLLTDKGVDAICKRHLRVNSLPLVGEMDTFIAAMSASGVRKMEHAQGEHDDRLMALFIAYYVAHESDSIAVAEERARMHAMRNAPPEKTRQLWEVAASMGVGEDPTRAWEESVDIY